MAERIVLVMANQIQKRLARNYAEYVAECEQDRRDGFCPHYCEHGMNMWTEYDNICGYCEEGITMRDGVMRRERALTEAKRRMSAFKRANDALNELRELRLVSPYTAEYDALVTKACEFLHVDKYVHLP